MGIFFILTTFPLLCLKKYTVHITHTHLSPICSCSRSHLCCGQQRQRAMCRGLWGAFQNVGRGGAAWCRAISFCQQTSKSYLWKSSISTGVYMYRCFLQVFPVGLLYSQGWFLMFCFCWYFVGPSKRYECSRTHRQDESSLPTQQKLVHPGNLCHHRGWPLWRTGLVV